MKNKTKIIDNTDVLYSFLTNDAPCFIEGRDFMACNYGKRYAREAYKDHRMIVLSGEKASYKSITAPGEFPKRIVFENLNTPYTGIVNMSHILDDIAEVNTSLTLENLIDSLQKKGMKFEK